MLCLAVVSCSTSGSGQPEISVNHATALLDVPLSISISGLPAQTAVTVEATAVDCDHTPYASEATFMSTSRGTLDLDTASPLSGGYSGTHGMGLFDVMRPATGGEYEFEFCVPHSGFQITLTAIVAGHVVARIVVTRLWSLSGVTMHDLRPGSDGFYGEYFSPAPGAPKRPGVVIFGGSEGGLSVLDDAALLASHGYPSVALAYFGEPGIPSTEQNIPLEYFAKSLRWLAAQRGVDANTLVVDGGSRGGEAALLLGVYYPTLVHAVIAQTTSNVALCGFNAADECDGPSWTLHGAPLPYSTNFHDPAPANNPGAVIPVERIDGPILHDCGGQDALIPSCLFGMAIEARLTGTHFSFRHEFDTYEAAGHFVNAGVPYRPIYDINLGGTLEANQLGVADFWTRQLAFLAALGN